MGQTEQKIKGLHHPCDLDTSLCQPGVTVGWGCGEKYLCHQGPGFHILNIFSDNLQTCLNQLSHFIVNALLSWNNVFESVNVNLDRFIALHLHSALFLNRVSIVHAFWIPGGSDHFVLAAVSVECMEDTIPTGPNNEEKHSYWSPPKTTSLSYGYKVQSLSCMLDWHHSMYIYFNTSYLCSHPHFILFVLCCCIVRLYQYMQHK